MRKLISLTWLCMLISTPFSIQAQAKLERPKLVVGIVLDQMRWDYLYRYYDRYATNGGFKKMITGGFSCENTMIPYSPTVTACGHSVVYTGSAPSLTGIVGNTWWDQEQKRTVYCTEDKSVSTVGSPSTLGKMSPRNMWVTTVADELRLATNFSSKVIGVSIKDRGAILPAGHSANGAYWYDNSNGKWISSTYYINTLPDWAASFNLRNLPDSYYAKGWNLLYPLSSYAQSTQDEKPYEANVFGNAMPYDLKKYIGKDYGKINTTTYGNEMTLEFAKAALEGESLGKDAITDLLAISFSSPDYIGHSFGPNSVEAEDAMLRIDILLGSFFDYLDKKIGKGQYTVFLTADHGAAHIPEFMQENNLPAGRVFASKLVDKLNKSLEEKFKLNKLIVSDDNYQLHFDHDRLDSAGISLSALLESLKKQLAFEPGIDRVFSLQELNQIPLPQRIKDAINLGYHPTRSGDLQLIFKPGFIDSYGKTGTTHGLWNPYDSHIPLLWYGWGIRQGKTNRETYMHDIAPTLAALLHIQMPNGCLGVPIPEVIR